MVSKDHYLKLNPFTNPDVANKVQFKSLKSMKPPVQDGVLFVLKMCKAKKRPFLAKRSGNIGGAK